MEEKDILERRAFFVVGLSDDHLVDFGTVFGNDHPVHIEIGSGRGEYLALLAPRTPEVNYIGFELQPDRIVSTLKKIAPVTHGNVRLVLKRIGPDLSKWVPGHSISRVYIRHPDPWPKRKHHKNRLIQKSFLDTLAWLLTDGAEVHVQTDHRGYADWILKHFTQHTDFSVLQAQTGEREADHIVTHFEQMKQREGFDPVFMKFQRRERA